MADTSQPTSDSLQHDGGTRPPIEWPTASQSPPSARRTIDEYFLTPRVIDEGAFNELAGSLKSLIEKATDAQQSLWDQLAIGKRSTETLNKVRPEIHRQTVAANRLVEVLAKSVERLDAMIQRAQARTIALDATEDRIAAAIESRLDWLDSEIEQRVNAALERVRAESKPVLDQTRTLIDDASRLCDRVDQRARALDEHTERAISAAGTSIDAEIRALDETVRTMSDRAVGEAIDRADVQSTLHAITERIALACESAQHRTTEMLSTLNEKIEVARRRATEVGLIDFEYLGAVCDRAETFIGSKDTTDESSPVNRLASLIDQADAASRSLASASHVTANYTTQAESAKKTIEASLLASAHWLDELHTQHEQLDQRVQESLIECEQVRLLAEFRLPSSIVSEDSVVGHAIIASQAEPKPIKREMVETQRVDAEQSGTTTRSLASAMTAWDEFAEQQPDETRSEGSEDNHLAELVEPRVAFVTGDVGESVEGKGLDDVAGHHGAVGERGSENRKVVEYISDFPFVRKRSEIPHHAAREGIASAGGINNFLAGVSRDGADAIAMDEQAAVLALFHDDELRAHGCDLVCSSDGVGQTGELLGLVIVEHKPVDFAHECIELGASGIDPQVHGVGDRERRMLDLFEQAQLDRGMRVGKKDKLGVSILRWDSGRFLDHNVQLGVQRFSGVHVVEILPAPAEGFGSLACLKTLKPDVRHALEQRAELLRKIIADNADDAHLCMMLRSSSEVGARASKHVLSMLAGRRVDGVDPDGASDDEGHTDSLSLSSFSLMNNRTNTGSVGFSRGLGLRAAITHQMRRSLPR